jgi:hypothetical protein
MTSSARVVPLTDPEDTMKRIETRMSNIESASESSGPARKPVVSDTIKVARTRKSTRALQGSGSSAESSAKPQTRIWNEVFQKRVAKLLDSTPVTVFMTIITVYALFGDDLRLASAPASADGTFYNISFSVLVIFLLELLLNCLARPNYVGSFYFWLDLISSTSLIVDIGWYGLVFRKILS